MRLRSLGFSFALVLCGFVVQCTAQQPTGPATLADLMPEDADAAAGQPASTEADKPAAEQTGPARPAGTLVRPKDGVQHPDLDKAWAEYDAAVAKATGDIKAAIGKQFEAATTKGDLDAAEKWQSAQEKIEKSGELPSEKEAKAVVDAAVADYMRAKNELAKAYETVVKALTMEKLIAEAKAAREEARLLSDATTVPNPKDGDWTVLFRSNNPANWNKEMNVPNHYSVPLSKAPRGVRYLRLTQMSGGAAVIIPMTNNQLGRNDAVSDRFGWAGEGLHRWNAIHLGIYALNRRAERQQISIHTWVAGHNEDRLGWGFGHKTYTDDRQYFSWGGREIPAAVLEIAVKCSDLTAGERERLLEK